MNRGENGESDFSKEKIASSTNVSKIECVSVIQGCGAFLPALPIANVS
jgi:hypothetical protein